MFSCYLIGETSLVLSCAEILLIACHRIKGIVSTNTQIIAWATQRGIKCFNSVIMFEKAVRAKSFDYLFSITNSCILRPSVLNLPKYFSINFHDALLPCYAGRNATTWALLQGEKIHGISWHLMTEVIDAGDILEQVEIPIDEGETACSLNFKCYQQGVKAFECLIKKLEAGKVKLFPQDKTLRSYYGINTVLPQGGFIDWSRPATEIQRLCRAVDFDHYPNLVGTVKLNVKERLYYVTQIDVLEKFYSGIPGRIVELNDKLLVETGTNLVSIRKLATVAGEVISPVQLQMEVGLQEDDMLVCNATQMEAWIIAYQQLLAHERFWIKSFQEIKQLQLPFIANNDEINGEVFQSSIRISCQLISGLKATFPKVSIEDVLLTALMVYLARLTEFQPFTVKVENKKKSIELFAELCSSYVPFTLEISADWKFEEVLEKVQKKRGELEKHLTYLHEIEARYPELKAVLRSFHCWPVCVLFTNEHEEVFHHTPSLCIYVENAGYRLRGALNFNSTTQCIVDHLLPQVVTLLEGIISNPSQPLYCFPLLTESEYMQLLKWNEPRLAYPDKTLMALFDEQVARTPNNVALIYEENKLSYRDLFSRANQVAHTLRKFYETRYGESLQPDTLIALFLDRSLEMIVGLLGILKAGGAYVPLDPNYPIARLQYMLEHTKAPLLLTDTLHMSLLPRYSGEVVCIDRDKQKITQAPTDAPDVSTQPSHLAYVIYTSGSTGKPKGVMVEQAGVAALAIYANSSESLEKIDSTSCILQIVTFSFDASVFDWSRCLLNGACLVIAHQMTSECVLDLIDRYRITHAVFPSAILSVLPLDKLKSLKCIITMGDVCKFEILEKLSQFCRVINGYGPTEATVATSLFRYESHFSNKIIGKPIAGRKIYILDAYGQLCPIGIPGELYIGGIGVARGYINYPELTQERFIENPFVSDEDKIHGRSLRLYRTGDRVRYLPDGNLEFLGRLDRQVKLRGYRIECGEIEQTLLKSPGVSQALVNVREEGELKQLVAYVVPKMAYSSLAAGFFEINSSILRKYLQQYLPDYMIPSYFVVLAAFPLMLNGKVDYQALPPPDSNTGHKSVPARTDIEVKLVALWEEVLHRRGIGIEDNFFMLGGDSLMAIQISFAIEKLFHCYFSVKDLFIYPIVVEQARYIEISQYMNVGIRNDLSEVLIWPIKKSGMLNPLFLIHPLFGLCWSYAALVPYFRNEQPLYGINDPYWGTDKGFTGMEAMAIFYVKALQILQPQGPYRLGGWSLGGNIALEMAKVLANYGHSVEIVILIDSFPEIAHVRKKLTKEEKAEESKDFLAFSDLYKLGKKEKEAFKQEIDKLSAMLTSYRQCSYAGTVVLLKADRISAYEKIANMDQYNGWERYLKSISLYSVKGAHKDLFNAENVLLVAQAINHCLTKNTKSS